MQSRQRFFRHDYRPKTSPQTKSDDSIIPNRASAERHDMQEKNMKQKNLISSVSMSFMLLRGVNSFSPPHAKSLALLLCHSWRSLLLPKTSKRPKRGKSTRGWGQRHSHYSHPRWEWQEDLGKFPLNMHKCFTSLKSFCLQIFVCFLMGNLHYNYKTSASTLALRPSQKTCDDALLMLMGTTR